MKKYKFFCSFCQLPVHGIYIHKQLISENKYFVNVQCPNCNRRKTAMVSEEELKASEVQVKK